MREPAESGGAGSSSRKNASRRFEELAAGHMDLIYRMARRMCGDSHEAEDLTQETFLRAFRSFDQFELREYGAKAWLLKILYNVFFSRRGGPPTFTEASLDDFAIEASKEPPAGLPPGALDWEELDEELAAALDALSPENRSTLLLWAVGDLSYREIGDAMGCAMGTVMSRIHRARQQLHKELVDYAAKRGLERPTNVKQ